MRTTISKKEIKQIVNEISKVSASTCVDIKTAVDKVINFDQLFVASLEFVNIIHTNILLLEASNGINDKNFLTEKQIRDLSVEILKEVKQFKEELFSLSCQVIR